MATSAFPRTASVHLYMVREQHGTDVNERWHKHRISLTLRHLNLWPSVAGFATGDVCGSGLTALCVFSARGVHIMRPVPSKTCDGCLF